MDDIPDDNLNNDGTIPIMPQVQQPPQIIPKVENQPGNDTKPAMLPRVIGTAIKVEKPSGTATTPQPRMKVFKTVEYKLKRKYAKPRRFSCVSCNSSFTSQKEVNEHTHQSSVTCVKSHSTPLLLCCDTNTSTMNTCTNVMYVLVAFSLPVNYRNTNGYTRCRVIGSALSRNVAKDLNVNQNSMPI